MNDEFEKFVSRTTEALDKDGRFLGLAIAGSWVSNEIDEFSDLDLLIYCANGEVPDLTGMREFAASLGTLVSSFPGYDVNSCYRAVLASIDIYRELRSNVSDSVIANERAEATSVRYLKEVASRIHNLK